MIEMTIDSIRVSELHYQHVVILKEKGSDRYLPIWIGPAEADAIAIKLQNVNLPRPMTHDLLKNTMYAFESASGTVISKVVVNDLREDTFFAQIVFESTETPKPVGVKFASDGSARRSHSNGSKMSVVWQGKEYKLELSDEWQESGDKFVEGKGEDGLIFVLRFEKGTSQWLLNKIKLDSRPSDAIALAVRTSVPLYVEEAVLDKAGIILDRDTGKLLAPDKNGEKPGAKGKKVDEQELKKFSGPLKDFINTLNLDDLGKRKS